MRLSTKSEYACLALIELAKNHDSEWITIEEIARRHKIPKKYLEQILLSLNRSGFTVSKRGVNGGYRLAMSPDNITVAEIIRLMDGPLAPVHSASEYFYQHTPIEKNARLLALFCEIRDYIAERLENTTFKDLIG